MKQLIIVNHIGTSVLETVEKELLTLVNEIEAKRPHARVVLAFGSDRARRKLGSKGMSVQSIQQALEEGIAGDYEKITILPLHLIGGRDYSNLEAVVEVLDMGIELQKPLLSDELQCRILARAIRDSLAEEDRYKCIVAVGHGTEDSGLIYYEQLKQALKALDLDIRMITLKTALSTLAPMPEALVLYPLFTVSGYHVKKDVFGESDSIRSTLEAAGHKVTVYDHGLLAMADVRRVYLDRL